ncbi:MAG: hypothetical protein Q9219_005453 [cf. Caloplaca sp. 3 TL-2023]
MASSLPNDGNGGRFKRSKPAKEQPNIVDYSHRSEDTLTWRKRATTVTGPVPGTLLDRRSHLQENVSVPHVDLKKPPRSHLATQSAVIVDDPPSAPIAIPRRKSQPPRPVTPLTGREPSFKFLRSPTQSPDSRHIRSNSKGFTPSPDSPSQSSLSDRSQIACSPVSRRTMKTDTGPSSSLYTPSPLSPTIPTYSTPSLTAGRLRPQSHNKPNQTQPAQLAMPTLPPFHPANYESSHPSPRHVARHVGTSHSRQPSEAQKSLQRYQRDLVINATRSATRYTTRSPVVRPNSPRLDPLGSPGPVTPLTLEEQSDYFLAGPGTSPTMPLSKAERRSKAERLIAIERDRIAHPGRVERHSPAVSPAGGRG